MFFSDAQEQLTLQSVVKWSQILNLTEILWLSSQPAKMMKIQSKKKVLECCNIKHLFFRRPRAANSAVRSRIWPNFKLIRTLMVVLITLKNEEDPIKTEGARVWTTLSPL